MTIAALREFDPRYMRDKINELVTEVERLRAEVERLRIAEKIASRRDGLKPRRRRVGKGVPGRRNA